ncbi:flagellar basal body L-ring protein FlgH [Hydrogenophaga sp.]|uniref:flagellar basal body L-ring protein FlgH n=1 Tax=Hydrogenophaga sp. TaxID=1904254 RepID=UPI003F6ACCD0
MSVHQQRGGRARAVPSVWVLAGCLCVLGGCAVSSADRRLDEPAPTTVKPRPVQAVAASQGSLFPSVRAQGSGYRPLFEDRRARQVGDTLTVVLEERTTASKRSSAAASKESSLSSGVTAGTKVPIFDRWNGLALGASSENSFAGKGSSSAANNFSGTITVTVMEVYANGNLVVAGEKRLAVSDEDEIIRFAGVVNPADLNSNAVPSVLVADARIEYRGRGAADDAQSPGILTRGILKFWPF